MATIVNMEDEDQEKSDYYDILLLGRTGMGKSTTGNKLLQRDNVVEGAAHHVQQWEDDEKQEGDTAQEGAGGGEEEHNAIFKTGKGVNSVTRKCKVISNEVSNIRVLDTPGFADSRDTKKCGVFRGNFEMFRSILRAQDEKDLAFSRVLYFIPQRGPLERADGTIQEELKLIHGFLGDEVFKIMVLVATNKFKTSKPQEEFDDEDIESTKKAFMTALQYITKERIIDKCPPVVFLRFDESDVVSEIVRAPVLYEEPLMKPAVIEASIDLKTTQQLIDNARQRNKGKKLRFHDRCAKCSAKIIYSESPKGKFPDRVIVNEGGENEKVIAYDKSKCHPILIPRYSTITKVVGGIFHILTGGMLVAAGKIRGRKFWPGFTNEDEMCANCKKAPSAEPCLEVNKTYHSKEISIDNVHSTTLDELCIDTQ